MKGFLIIISLLILESCNKTTTTSKEVQVEVDNMVKVCLNYVEPINGYIVTAICFVDTTHNYDSPNTNGNHNAIVGRAYIHFKNGTMQFTVENPLFSDSTLMANSLPLTNDIQISADYNLIMGEGTYSIIIISRLFSSMI